jgi:hypothetical protein
MAFPDRSQSSKNVPWEVSGVSRPVIQSTGALEVSRHAQGLGLRRATDCLAKAAACM